MKKPIIACLCMALVLSIVAPVATTGTISSAKETTALSVKADSAASGSAVDPAGDILKYYVDDEEVTISGFKPDEFVTDLVIPERIDGYPVTEIEYSAFSETDIQTVSLPSTLTTINAYAFENCEKLKEITIPASVRTMRSYVFYGCDALKKVTFKTNKLDTISDGTFSYCKKLESIKLPSSVKRIEYCAFYHCTKLSSVTLNSKLEYIGTQAFRDDYALESIKIPASVKNIGEEAFYNCSKLKRVTFNGSKAKFDVRSFARCKALTKFKIPSVMTEIPEFAFYGCESLSSITIPSKVRILKKSCFANCEKLKSIKLPKNVYAIGDQAFQESGLKSIKLDKSLQYIGNGAFNGTNLSSVKLPGKVAYIGNRVFKDCDRLKSIRIPASVKGLNPGAFGGCTSLGNIQVDAGNKKYSSQNGVLFDKEKKTLLQYPVNKKSASYTVPSSVEVIRSHAFEGNRHLHALTLGAKKIHHDAFSDMAGLKSVTMTSGVEVIADQVFYDDSALKTVTIPDSVRTIGANAFTNTAVRTIHIPNGLKKLGSTPFYNCNKLSSFTGDVSGTYRVIDGVLYTKTKDNLSLLQYPAARKGTEFTVPAGVTKVEDGAFRKVKNIRKLYFEQSIKYLDTSSIEYCKKLRQVVFADNTKLKSGHYAILHCPKLAVIVGPKQYVLSSMASNANATLITL